MEIEQQNGRSKSLIISYLNVMIKLFNQKRNWQNELKNMIQLYAIYKKPPLDPKAQNERMENIPGKW